MRLPVATVVRRSTITDGLYWLKVPGLCDHVPMFWHEVRRLPRNPTPRKAKRKDRR